jgi:hypothetical protein
MMHTRSADPWAEEPVADARRIAEKRREARIAKDTHWLTVEQALKIESTTDPTRLRMELKLGLPCRYRRRDRWWVWKPQEEVAPLLAGRNPLDLQDGLWELVIHEAFWRERLGRSAAPAPPGDAPPPATETAVEPSPPSAELPSQRAVGTPALAAPSTSKRKRANVRAQPGTYSAHVAEHLERTGEYPSETDDKIWAGNNGYIQKHITKVLRRQYRGGLAEPEQLKFQDKGKHRSNKDPCP